MKMIQSMMLAASLLATVAGPATAQESSYKPGSVWVSSRIAVKPGQFENYLDWLKNNWKVQMEFFKKEGVLLSYHVLEVNHARQGEPDLILLQEWKDYASTAQREALVNKFLAQRQTDARQMTTASGAREVMREQIGSTEYQELMLK